MALGSLLDYRQRNDNPQSSYCFYRHPVKIEIFQQFLKVLLFVSLTNTRYVSSGLTLLYGRLTSKHPVFLIPQNRKGNNHLNPVLLQKGPKILVFWGLCCYWNGPRRMLVLQYTWLAHLSTLRFVLGRRD